MFGLKPKEDKFFELFARSACLVQKGAFILKDAVIDVSKMEEKMQKINDLEHEADDLNDAIVDKLNQTFITPLDREDIFSIATMLDDVVDFLQGIIESMVLYRAGRPSDGFIEMVRMLADCSDEIVKAFNLLRNIHGNQMKILDHTRKIVVLESEADRIYRQEIAYLFTTCPDPIEILKWKEILENLENTLDHCELIADLLRGVVMKYA